MDAPTLPASVPATRSSSLPRLLGAAALAITVCVVDPAPPTILAQDPSPSGSVPALPLTERLPARIADTPVQLELTDDLGTWVDEAFPAEEHTEFDALDGALAAQGATRSEVQMAWASAHDSDIQITGFQIPGLDAEALRDPILAVYFLGLGDLTRTEQQIDGHPVTVVSRGPLEDDGYPSGIIAEGDTVWVASAGPDLLRQTMQALIGAATGTVARLDPVAARDPGYAAPWSWDGTVSQTITWDKGSYRGTEVGRLTGAWVLPLTTVRYCESDDCTAYIPTGTIDWSWDVSAPTRPPCAASTHGSLDPGTVVIPSDQMLFLDPGHDGFVRFWGSGTFRLPDQPCVGWEGDHGPGSFFSIPMPEDGDPFADESSDQYPSCGNRQWRFAAEDTTISGRCWNYREPGYEDVVEWDLVAREG